MGGGQQILSQFFLLSESYLLRILGIEIGLVVNKCPQPRILYFITDIEFFMINYFL